MRSLASVQVLAWVGCNGQVDLFGSQRRGKPFLRKRFGSTLFFAFHYCCWCCHEYQHVPTFDWPITWTNEHNSYCNTIKHARRATRAVRAHTAPFFTIFFDLEFQPVFKHVYERVSPNLSQAFFVDKTREYRRSEALICWCLALWILFGFLTQIYCKA